MDTIKFANGEVHDCTFLSTIPYGDTKKASIALGDVGFEQAAAIFSNVGKTAQMEYGQYVLVGYTRLEMLVAQPYGIQANLTGGHDEIRG